MSAIGHHVELRARTARRPRVSGVLVELIGGVRTETKSVQAPSCRFNYPPNSSTEIDR
jgi:hypothetical protein